MERAVISIKKNKECYISAEIKLNKVVKSFSNSSILSDVEMLSLIALTYIKLKLDNYEEARINLRQLETLIIKSEEQNLAVLSDVLKQFKYYFEAKKNIYELIRIKDPKGPSENLNTSISEISYGSQIESYYGISEIAAELGIRNIHLLIKEKIKRNTTIAARNLLLSLFGTKYIDPELYSSTLRLLIVYHKTVDSGDKCYEVSRLLEYLNFDTSFNLMV